jgi:hypothetical protein
MGFILFFISYIASVIFAPLGLIYALFCKGRNEYFGKVALSIDQLDNVIMSKLFNKILIKKGGYLFGNEDQTISYCIGKNKELKKLTKFGYFWSRFLNKLDANHVEDAVINEEK